MGEGSYSISRLELRHLLASFKVSEKSIESILSGMERAHRHINVITLASALEGYGVSVEQMREFLRRVGMGDVTIERIIEMVDEHKIMAASGRIYEIKIG